MKENEKWIKAFKEKLEDYSEPIPASGWERLEKELMPVTERRIYPYRRWAVAAAAVVLVVTTAVSLYFLNSPVADEIRYATAPSLAVNPDILPEPALPDVQVAVSEPMKPAGGTDVSSASGYLAKGNDPKITPEAFPEAEKHPEAVVAEKPAESQSEATAVTEKKESTASQIEKRKEARRPSGKDKYQLPIESSSARRNGKWSMGVGVGYGGGLPTNGSESFAPRPMSNRVDLMTIKNGAVHIPAVQEVVFEGGVPYLKSSTTTVMDYEHHQPVSFGLSVRKSLPKGFSVETGLTYTLLSSDVKRQGDNKMQTQKLHYIGIPVRGNWNFLEKKYFTLYVSAGGMVEKCVYGKLAGDKVNVKPLQFSVAGAVGAQFNATEHVGFYVEPGVSYFFDDGSKIQTIRKETPCNFNLQAGLRFTY